MEPLLAAEVVVNAPDVLPGLLGNGARADSLQSMLGKEFPRRVDQGGASLFGGGVAAHCSALHAGEITEKTKFSQLTKLSQVSEMTLVSREGSGLGPPDTVDMNW
jgi:hypothetical protein